MEFTGDQIRKEAKQQVDFPSNFNRGSHTYIQKKKKLKMRQIKLRQSFGVLQNSTRSKGIGFDPFMILKYRHISYLQTRKKGARMV